MKLSRRTALKLLGLSPFILPLGKIAMTAQTRGSLHYIHPEHIVGDMHPFYHDGKWYVYYLAPGFYSKLMISTDLLHWEQVPITHAQPQGGDQDLAPYFVLGVFRDMLNGVFRTYHGWSGGNMHSHTSENLTHWEFAPSSYRVLAQYTRYSSQRDPYVFWNEAEGQYWCVMTCKVEGYDDEHSGAVGYASSPDLQRWTGRGDLYFPENIREPEVPQVFNIGGTWYLLASIHDGTSVGKPSYWMSDAPTGPWSAAIPDSLDGQDLSAANVGFDGQRWLLFGWIPLTTMAAHGRYTWGGHVAFPRELYQLLNGELGMRLEPSISAAIRGELLFDAAAQPVMVRGGEWALGDTLTYSSSDGEGVVDLPGVYNRMDIDVDFMPSADNLRVALRLFDFIDIGIEQNRLIISRRGGVPYAELPIRTETQYQVRIIVEDDIVEMFVNDRYSLCARLPQALGETNVALVASGGGVVVRALRAYRLRDASEIA